MIPATHESTVVFLYFYCVGGSSLFLGAFVAVGTPVGRCFCD
jgi:hypothetical protein